MQSSLDTAKWSTGVRGVVYRGASLRWQRPSTARQEHRLREPSRRTA